MDVTGEAGPSAGAFAVALALLIVVAGTIGLPGVWLRSGPTAPPPESIFDSGPSRVGEWVCVADDDCVRATGSLVVNLDGSVAWVINPENPLTTLAVDERGQDENVRIESIREVDGRIHLRLRSGRIVTRTREGTWRPGVGAFRDSTTVSIVIAAAAASAVVAGAWLRARRVERSTVVVAGLAASAAHLPVTIWEHSTALSLSTAVVLSGLLVLGGAIAGLLVARPRRRRVSSAVVGSHP